MSRVPTATRTPRKASSNSTPRDSSKPTSLNPTPGTSTRGRTPTSPLGARTTAKSGVGSSSSTSATSARPSASESAKKTTRVLATPPKPQSNGSPATIKSPSKSVNLREAIALKRAEAKRTAENARRVPSEDSLWNEGRGAQTLNEEEDILGRECIPETIEKAKRNGNLNLNSRSLSCLPKFLFETHLGVTPDALESLPLSNDESPQEYQVKTSVPSWQAQDLGSLKASDNVIVELHHEISLFGGLKHLDLHRNKLKHLPKSLIDLVNLMYLDLSKNELAFLPPNFASLPALRTLNLSENELTSIDFSISNDGPSSMQTDSFFAPSIQRASEPFPKLQTLDLSHNLISAGGISCDNLPQNLESLDLSFNKLGQSQQLIEGLSRLPRLVNLDMSRSELGEDPFSNVTQETDKRFLKLATFKLLHSRIPEEAIREAFPSRMLSFDVVQTRRSSASNTLEVILNPPVIKEAWELEAERRLRPSLSRNNLKVEEVKVTSQQPREVVKEDWEIDAEQGLMTEGAKRRLRASKQVELEKEVPKIEIKPAKPVEKEQWEIDAEQGLLTEGAKRRARALAIRDSEDSLNTADRHMLSSRASTHSIATFYNESRQTLELPPALPRPKSHSRARSLAAKLTPQEESNPLLPDSTLPLSKIVEQPFAGSLRILTLSNRRVNPCFELSPLTDDSLNPPLPVLDELNMVSCGLADTISIATKGSDAHSQPLLPLISFLFPSLSSLDISHNGLTTLNGIDTLLTPDWDKRRKSLKVFKARGNRITNIDGITSVCDGFKNDCKIDGWRLEEMDLRDNDIQKLPPALGLLPLDVLLVNGNAFRVPARRVWEREGTKGLLLWLRQRLEA